MAVSPTHAQPCELDLDLSFARPTRLTRLFRAEVTGKAYIPDLCPGQEVTGTMTCNWWPRPSATFQLCFGDKNEGRISATWRPNALHPTASWTRMWARVDAPEMTVAWLQLHFDIRRDLATLVTSIYRSPTAPEIT